MWERRKHMRVCEPTPHPTKNRQGGFPKSCFHLKVNAENKKTSPPSRWMTLAFTNKPSLHLWLPPTRVHSRPKNMSTVPTRPRIRPAIKSPLAAWMWADKPKTNTWVLKSHVVRAMSDGVPTFDCPQDPKVHTVHHSSGVFVTVFPQVRPVPSCGYDGWAPLTPQLGHPHVRERNTSQSEFSSFHFNILF